MGLYCFEQYLRFRKHKASLKELPDKIRERNIITEEEYNKTREYSVAKNKFGFFADTYGTITSIATTFLAPLLWSKVVEYNNQETDFLTVFLFTLVSSTIETIMSLPLGAYSTFVIEEQFGFNKYSVVDYVKDKLKSFFIMDVALNGALMCGMVYMLEMGGENAWFYSWLFISAFVLFFNMLYPVLIAPLFNTFGPLKDENIRKEIYALIEQTGLSCDKVFEVDGSRQSSHSNAYVGGFFGSKRIVIYDTLIKDLNGNIDEIKAVVAHEIGHSIMMHNWVLLGAAMGNLFTMFFGYGFVQNHDYVPNSFGYKNPNAFLRLQCFMALFNAILSPAFSVMQNAIVRKCELDADEYAAKTLDLPIGEALIGISKTNKEDLNSDWLHSLWHHSHPPLITRLEAVSKYMKKDN